jgi:hypothetical protein
MTTFALAATIHDPDGKLVPAIAGHAAALRAIFAVFAINVTTATHPDVTAALKRALDAFVITHETGECPIAKARRDAVGLALAHSDGQILHSDFDHVLRWLDDKPGELQQVLADQSDVDFLVVGRSAKAFAASPARLQETEKLVNHIYFLMTGHEWDLMFAVRRFSRKAAETIVRLSHAHDLANDVEWPLLAAREGLSLGYAAADGLLYRTMDDFGSAADTHDAEPAEWIKRIRIADEHAQTMAMFLKK